MTKDQERERAEWVGQALTRERVLECVECSGELIPGPIVDWKMTAEKAEAESKRLREALEFVAHENCGRSVNSGGPCPRFSPVGTPITCEHIVAREALANPPATGRE